MLAKKSDWVKARRTFFERSPLIIGAFTAALAFFSYLLASWLFGGAIRTRVAASLALLMGAVYYALTAWAIRSMAAERQKAPPALKKK